VEPRGFEPLTSAVQRRNQYVVQPYRAVSARTIQPYKCAIIPYHHCLAVAPCTVRYRLYCCHYCCQAAELRHGDEDCRFLGVRLVLKRADERTRTAYPCSSYE
jgi:hypothetical protein